MEKRGDSVRPSKRQGTSHTSGRRAGRGPDYRPEALEKRFLLSGSVVINEINYNPPDKTKPTEFVELTNPGDAPVDLTGASFTKGFTYAFPAGTILQPGGYLVVAENPAALKTAYGVTALGPFAAGSLSNSGEELLIVDASGNTLDDVTYGVGFPWPLVGDSPGPGYSIELINPTLDNNLGGNWRAYNPVATQQVTLIPAGSTWDYRKGTSEVTASPYSIGAWRGLDYVESGWSSGATPIGYAPAGGPTMRTTLSDMSGSYSSVFMRKTLYIPDPAEVLGLTLNAMYDDGFNVWVNGRLAQTVNTPGGSTAYNGLASTARAGSDTASHPFTINPTFLQAGDNEIAVQFFNAAKTDTDAYFDASLVETTGTGGPTPGRQSSVYSTAAPPVMRHLDISSQVPTPNTPVTISLKVTDPGGLSSVSLSYQTVDPGNYFSQQDAAYTDPANWTTVPMNDQGVAGDATAADDVYSVQIPASVQVDRRLVRYRITATGADGQSVTGPYADDPVENFAYYVYAGTPAYTAALQPGASGAAGQANTFSPTTLNSVPTLQLLTKQQDHDNSQSIPGSNSPASTGNEYSFSGTLVYNGVVYDNIHYRSRGGVWRYAMGKNMWKFDFQNGHDFQPVYPDGTPTGTQWKKLNLGANIQQGDIGDRGEQGLFDTMSYEMFRLAGVPASVTIPTTLRIVENAAEGGTSQYNTDFQGLYLATEEPDGRFLDDNGLPDGNFYKIEGGAGTSKNQGKTAVSDGSDLTAFISALSNNPSEQWIQANIDLPEFYSFQAVMEMIHDYDKGFGKNYYYYHNPTTNKWDIVPWDEDLTWYVNYAPSGGDITPFASAILSHPDLQLQYRNRVRELRDLLFNGEQLGEAADAYANTISPTGAGPTLAQADAAEWDYNPIESSSYVNSSKATAGRFYLNGQPTQDFAGMVARLKSWAASRFTYLDTTTITTTDQSAAPTKPAVTYTGPAGFPINGLTFSAGAFSPGNTGGAFAAMQWRIADVTPGPATAPNLEIHPEWDSGPITNFNANVTVPAAGLLPGHLYRVRVREEDSNGRWSDWSDVAGGATQFIAGVPTGAPPGAIRVSELNYDPAKPPTGSAYNNDDFEYIELQNFSNQVVSLAGDQFTDGVSYTFGNVTLNPGQAGVLVHNTAAFQSRYGTGPLILGDYASTGQSFSNSGEHVHLQDAYGLQIADFAYDPTWYPATAGGGASLQVIDPAVGPDLNLAANWRASTTAGGDPGTGVVPALTPPTGASAQATASQINLQWTPSTGGANGYVVFRGTGNGQFTQIASLPTTATTYADNNGGAGLTPGTGYEYLIQAFNASGYSSPADVTAVTLTAAPTNLAISQGSGGVVLTWSAPTGAAGYNVYRGTAAGGEAPTPIAAGVASPTWTDTTAASGSNYYYVVTALNSAGAESARSSEVVAKLGVADYYTFDEGTGTAAADSAGGNNGTLVGATKPTWVAGKVGTGSLSFTGTGTYDQTNQSAVQVANDLSPILGSTSSLDAWIKTTQLGSNTHWQAPAITGVEQSGGGNDINWGTLNASGQIGLFVGESGSVYSTKPVNDGQWHNVAMTRDATTGAVQLFVDGVLQGSAQLETGNKTSQFKLIGALSDVDSSGATFQGANYFNGQLDDVRIYSRVISAAEAAALTAGPPSVSAVTIADGSAQRSVIRSLTVSFNQAVQLAPGAITLSLLDPTGANPPQDISSTVLGTPTTADGGKTWLIPVTTGTAYSDASGSLADGSYTLTVHASAVSAAGLAMSGDYVAGFHRLFGDSDGNKTVNPADYARFKQAFGSATGSAGYNAAFDFDGNGTVNALDYAQFKSRFGKVIT